MVVSDRARMLTATIEKLLHRKAMANIRRILSKTHSADIAAVLQNLTPTEAFEIFKLEPDASIRAEILSYLEDDLQKIFFTNLSNQEGSELVHHMDTDDAADLLKKLPEEDSKNILENMEEESLEEVVDLMTYPEGSAGGMMSSDHAAFQEDLTVEHVVRELQSEEMENIVTFYIYVLNDSGQLVGVVSLKQLLLSKKTNSLKQLMHPSVISVKVDTDQEVVAKTVERYDFLSLPVIDENNKLVGVITVDDVIDVIREEAEENLLAMGQAGWGVDMALSEHFIARLPWQLMAFLTGCVCYGMIYWFGLKYASDIGSNKLWAMTAYIPMLLAVGAMVGNQSATVMVGALQTNRFMGGKLKTHLFREMILALQFATLLSVFVWIIGVWLLPNVTWQLELAASMAVQILIAISMGATLPLLMRKVNLDPAIATVPLLTAIADISAIAILFGLFYAT